MVSERVVTVRVREGLHARPATQFVKLAKSFRSDVEIRRGSRGADAKSSVKLMLLGVRQDDEIVIRADGEDAEAAVASLADFVADPSAGLEVGAKPAAPPPQPARVMPATVTGGIGASEGAALGPAFKFLPVRLVPERRLDHAPEAIATERAAYRGAVEAIIADFLAMRARRGASARAEDNEIVDALIEVARDSEFAGVAEARIAEGLDAASAAIEAGEDLARRFEALDDPYLKARAEDVRGVGRTIGLALHGLKDVDIAQIPAGAIILAEDLSAWDLAMAPMERVAGILCTTGAATSHVAIMARTHGVPAVLGYPADAAHLAQVTRLAIDGGTGEVVLDPSPDVEAVYRARIARDGAARQALTRFAAAEPRTRDGRLIEVAANLGSLSEIEPALKAGAMGVGLFRTELLFMERRTLPTEDEQTEVYATLARAFAPHPVIVRTLDVGGDKPVAGIDCPPEANPFLGWRGIRMCLDCPELFRPQLKALLRAAVAGNIKVMLPMIADIDELRRAKALAADCRAELVAAGQPVGEIAIGVMIETPAAALMADDLAREAAFFSIGTNDLTQYVMAADRLNPKLAGLNRPDHPAVLRAVEMVCTAARQAGIWVGICGEAAAREDLIPTWVRMGVCELSMSPSSIPRAKRRIIEM